jgi:hypothetical protein
LRYEFLEQEIALLKVEGALFLCQCIERVRADFLFSHLVFSPGSIRIHSRSRPGSIAARRVALDDNYADRLRLVTPV